MELFEFHNEHKIKPLEIDTTFVNSHVVTPFCISWARDDKILLTAEDGVYVFELWPMSLSEQQSVTFLKSWIPVSTVTPLSKAVVDDKNCAFIWSLGREQAFETALDSTLSSALNKSSSAVGVIQCEFSPLIGSKSYIALLTNNGGLEIYRNNMNKWDSVINITQLWVSHCYVEHNLKNITFDYFKSKMLELKIIAIKWFEEPDLIFITGHENGSIVVWNVTKSKNSLEMSVRHKLKVDGKPHTFELIRVENTQNCILFVGTVTGVVRYISVNLTTGEINQVFDLWKDEDLLIPSLIKAKCMDCKLFVFTVKHHTIVIQNCSVDTSYESVLLMTRWQEFPTSVVSFNEYQNDYLICLQSHDCYILSIKDSEINVNLIDMGVKLNHKNSYHCYGLTVSQNKGIWILVSSPKANYDSLKEITQLIIYSPEVKMFKTLSDTTASGLLEEIVKQFESTRLSEVFDFLELKRLELLMDASKFKDSYEFHCDLSLTRLQLMLWEVKLKSYGNFDSDLDSIAADLEMLISKKQAEKLVTDLKKCEVMSGSQKRSLNVCQNLLSEDKEKNKTSNEECSVCGCECFFENIRISTCVKLHKFPRCCLSLLPCDEIPYAICRNCDSVALLNFVSENSNRCTFCDGLLESDTRIRVVS